MKPESPAPAELLNLLREQVLLAQARIMELEDERDTLAPRLQETASLLAAAQALVERKAAEADHLAQVQSGLQREFEHLRHTQHVTNEALNASRTEAGQLAARQRELLAEVEQLHVLTRQLAESEQQHLGRLAELERDLTAAREESAARQARILELDGELRRMKASRSWRWTAWLRSLERLFS